MPTKSKHVVVLMCARASEAAAVQKASCEMTDMMSLKSCSEQAADTEGRHRGMAVGEPLLSSARHKPKRLRDERMHASAQPQTQTGTLLGAPLEAVL
eukprot:6198921-Pleurochrysis_carterae.AAC.3